MVTKIQVPDIAGTIQRAGQGFRDQRNLNRERQDKIASDEVDAAKLEGVEAHSRLEKIRTEFQTGIDKIEEIRSQSADEKSAYGNTQQMLKLMGSVAAKADMMAQRLGGDPDEYIRTLSAATQSPTGGTLGVDAGRIEAAQGNAQTAGTNFAAKGSGAGIEELNKRAQLPVDPTKTVERKRTKDSRGVEYFVDDGTPVLQADADRVDAADAVEAEDLKTKEELRKTTLTTDAQNVIGSATKAMNLISWGSTGRVGQVTAWLNTDTDAQTLRLALETVEANLALTKLEQIRAAAVDGSSGLGQLSDKEFAALKASFANLSANQRAESLKAELTVILEGYNKLLGRYGAEYDESKDPRADEYWAAQEKLGNSRPTSQSQPDIDLNNDDDSKY